MNASRKLSASLEDYLEAIFWITTAKGAARSNDIAKRLRVKAASVTGALQVLAEGNYINYKPYESVTFTSEGLELAKNVVRRHQILKDFFTNVLQIDEKIADVGACTLEHGIPRPIVEKLVDFMEFVEICPRGGQQWIDSFIHHCETGSKENCKRCIALSLRKVEKEKLIMKTKEGISMTVADLKPGQKGVVIRIRRRGSIARRLADMGIGHGALVEMERVAPLGNPIDIKVKGYHLSLRKEEAASITISVH